MQVCVWIFIGCSRTPLIAAISVVHSALAISNHAVTAWVLLVVIRVGTEFQMRQTDAVLASTGQTRHAVLDVHIVAKSSITQQHILGVDIVVAFIFLEAIVR